MRVLVAQKFILVSLKNDSRRSDRALKRFSLAKVTPSSLLSLLVPKMPFPTAFRHSRLPYRKYWLRRRISPRRASGFRRVVPWRAIRGKPG